MLFLAFISFALILLSILLYKVLQLKRRFGGMGVDVSFQQAVNMLLQGGYEQGAAEAAARAVELEVDIPLDKLQIHAASGGNPLKVVEALHYTRRSPVQSARAGLKHLCLIDLSGKDPIDVVKEAEQDKRLEVSGVFEFSGRDFAYTYSAAYRRPVLSVAFDSFNEQEVRRELKRKIEDLHRYHKELLRVDIDSDDAIRGHILQNVLRPAFWERNFRLLLVEHELSLNRL